MSSTSYIGDISMVGFTFAPVNWLMCDGSLVNIADYNALFTLLGTTYGGDGQTTFALPDLRGRAPVHQGALRGGQSYALGQTHGAEAVTLTRQTTPAHTHPLPTSASLASSASPVGALPAAVPQGVAYAAASASSARLRTDMSQAGGDQPHENRPPTVAISFIICANGIYPTQQ